MKSTQALLPLALLLAGVNECTSETDVDQDGVSVEQGDCNDGDPTIYPGAPDLCNGVDNNCNGMVDEEGTLTYYRDEDGDGMGTLEDSLVSCSQPDGYVTGTGDCDDTNSTVHQGATELCDGLDNNCDGEVDSPECNKDRDGDGYDQVTDCNDGNPYVAPSAREVCSDLWDNDCDGLTDELDCDSDTSPIRFHDSGTYSVVRGCSGNCIVDDYLWVDARVADLAFTKHVWVDLWRSDGTLFVSSPLSYEGPFGTGESDYEQWGVDVLICTNYSTCTYEGLRFTLSYEVNGERYDDNNQGLGFPVAM